MRFFVLLPVLAFSLTGCTSTKHAAENEALSVARVMAINTSAALAGGKERDAHAMVNSVAGSPDVAFAILFDRDQNVFAEFFQPDQAPRKTEEISRVKSSLPIGADYFIEEPDLVIAISRIEDSTKLLGFVAVATRKK